MNRKEFKAESLKNPAFKKSTTPWRSNTTCSGR